MAIVKPKETLTAKGLGLNWPTGLVIQRDCNLGYRKPRVIRSVRPKVMVTVTDWVMDLAIMKGSNLD